MFLIYLFIYFEKVATVILSVAAAALFSRKQHGSGKIIFFKSNIKTGCFFKKIFQGLVSSYNFLFERHLEKLAEVENGKSVKKSKINGMIEKRETNGEIEVRTYFFT